MPALFHQLETAACFHRRVSQRRRARWDKRRKSSRQYESESVERCGFVFVSALDFAFAGFIDMRLNAVVVMMPIEMRVNQGRVGMITRTAISMDVLKRRQNKGSRQ